MENEVLNQLKDSEIPGVDLDELVKDEFSDIDFYSFLLSFSF